MILATLLSLNVFARAETVNIQPIIASRSAQRAIVLVESQGQYLFGVCPFRTDVERGTIGLDLREGGKTCRRIGRGLHSAAEVERVNEKFIENLLEYHGRNEQRAGRDLGKAASSHAGDSAIIGFGTGLIKALIDHNHGGLSMAARSHWYPAYAFGAAAFLGSYATLSAIDIATVIPARAVRPGVRFVVRNVDAIRTRDLVLIEDGFGTEAVLAEVESVLKRTLKTFDKN